ncbi:MAG TPA: hypothetical protein VFQ54_10405 [Thermomicrobiales bacterium]|nr:hypothetical protein [Thermomicrobiales bacterium]
MSRAARSLRAVHALIALVELVCLAYLWFCAVTNRRDRKLATAIAILGAEGVGLIVGGGNCPLGPFQRHLGDSTPLFELVLPKRAAKAAVPILTGVAVLGVAIVVVRSRVRPHRASQARFPSVTGMLLPDWSLGRRSGRRRRVHQ